MEPSVGGKTVETIDGVSGYKNIFDWVENVNEFICADFYLRDALDNSCKDMWTVWRMKTDDSVKRKTSDVRSGPQAFVRLEDMVVNGDGVRRHWGPLFFGM